MDWFLYDEDLRHERVKKDSKESTKSELFFFHLIHSWKYAQFAPNDPLTVDFDGLSITYRNQ